MSADEYDVISALAAKVDKVASLRTLVVSLLVGAFAVGAWATTLELRSKDHDRQLLDAKQENVTIRAEVDSVRKDLASAQKQAAGTDSRLASIEAKLDFLIAERKK